MTDINKLAEDFAKHVQYNKIDTMEYMDEIKQMREYQLVQPFRKVINELSFSFCINNGLWNRIRDYISDSTILDEDKVLLMLWTKNIFSFKDIKSRYYQGILKWYFDRLDKPIEDLLFDDITISDKKGKEINIAHKLYSKTPSIFLKLNKSDYIKESINSKLNVSNPLIRYINDYIEIGKSIQFNIKGFPMNQTLYLLCGMAITHALDYSKGNHSFKQLINLLRSYIQLNIKSLCLLPNNEKDLPTENKNEYYNLITYLKIEKDKYNYRYKCAEKYFNDSKDDSKESKDESKQNRNTKYCFGTNPGDEGKTFILTQYSTAEEYNKIWDELEKIYSSNNNKITDELIIKWFDGQLLTRSTCLIGCLLIVLKEHKTIEFIKDEMPDWKAIGMGTIKETYLIKNDILDVPHPKILNDVLDVLSSYIISKMK